jgi:hypothetical protein
MTKSQDTQFKDNLRAELLGGRTKTFWCDMANLYASDETAIKIFFEFMLEGQDRLARRTSEIIRLISDINPNIEAPFVEQMIQKLSTNCHAAVKRCIFRTFQRNAFNEAQAGSVVEHAFTHLKDRRNPIAVRIFAMTTLYNLCNTYPEIYQELEACINVNLGEESTGFQNRAHKILNRTWK